MKPIKKAARATKKKSARARSPKPPKIKHALVVEGGGFRNIFSAGVMDAFTAADFDPFDIYIGVSGGAMALSSYASKQYKRSCKIITEIAAHPEFVSARRFLTGGDYLGMDLLADIENEVFPFDVHAAIQHIEKKDFVIVCTDVDSGQPCYIRPNESDWVDYLQASGSVPLLIRKPFEIHQRRMLDGGLSSPLPVGRAVELGANRITVIRTRQGGYVENGVENTIESRIETMMGSYLYTDYPMLQKIIKEHASIYNAAVELLQDPPKGVEVVQIASTEALQSGLTQQTRNSLKADYRLGMELGLDFIHTYNQQQA